MRIGSIFREAAQALKFNRQRSILTMISLAWGVACFVILYSYGDGFHIALQTAFRSVGQDLVLMFNGRTSTEAGGERAGRRVRIEFADVEAIRDTVPLIAAISPEMMMGGMTVGHGYRTDTTMVRAVKPAYGKVRNQSMGSGGGLRPTTRCRSCGWRCWGPKRRTSYSVNWRPKARRSPSMACASAWWGF